MKLIVAQLLENALASLPELADVCADLPIESTI